MGQTKFTKELLQDCQLDISKKAVILLPLNIKLHASDGDPLHDPEHEHYMSLIGKLNFVTRPDLNYMVQFLSQFMQSPRTSHYELHHTLRYVAHTVGQGIKLQNSESLTLQAYSDSN